MNDQLNPSENGVSSHLLMLVLSVVGMLSSLAWKVYIGERHTLIEWLAISILSLFFSGGVSYLIYPNFEGEYGKLIITSIVAGAGTTVYIGALMKVGTAGVEHFRKMLIQVEEDNEGDF